VVFDITVNPASGSNIPATATDVTVTASTNMKWWIQLGSGNKDETADPSTYTTGGTRTITIPARDPVAKTSWTTNGSTFTVKAGYDAQTTVAANTPASYTYTQLPYWVNLSSCTPTSPTTSVTITVETNAGSVPIRLNVTDTEGQQVDNTKTLTSGVGTVYSLGSVTANRTVIIVNDRTGGEVGRFVQQPGTRYKNILLVGKTGSCPGGTTAGMGPDSGYQWIRLWTSLSTLASGTVWIQDGEYCTAYFTKEGGIMTGTGVWTKADIGEYICCYMGIVTE
jgi:hypothetical protein